jgi:LysM repeat protein
MQKRTTAPARAFAVIALVAAFFVLIVVIANSLGGGGSTGSGGNRSVRTTTVKSKEKVPTQATYVVQNGDTLTSIAHKTGVSIVRIQALNPDVDPQILISGEKLKLR